MDTYVRKLPPAKHFRGNIVATRNGRGSTLLANLVTKDTGFGAN